MCNLPSFLPSASLTNSWRKERQSLINLAVQRRPPFYAIVEQKEKGEAFLPHQSHFRCLPHHIHFSHFDFESNPGVQALQLAILQMEWLADHICGDCNKDEVTHSRKRCSFCTARTLAPEERSGAMKAIIEGERMQMELLKLLQSLTDKKETEAFRRNVTKVPWRSLCLELVRNKVLLLKLFSRVRCLDLCVYFAVPRQVCRHV